MPPWGPAFPELALGRRPALLPLFPCPSLQSVPAGLGAVGPPLQEHSPLRIEMSMVGRTWGSPTHSSLLLMRVCGHAGWGQPGARVGSCSAYTASRAAPGQARPLRAASAGAGEQRLGREGRTGGRGWGRKTGSGEGTPLLSPHSRSSPTVPPCVGETALVGPGSCLGEDGQLGPLEGLQWAWPEPHPAPDRAPGRALLDTQTPAPTDITNGSPHTFPWTWMWPQHPP